MGSFLSVSHVKPRGPVCGWDCPREQAIQESVVHILSGQPEPTIEVQYTRRDLRRVLRRCLGVNSAVEYLVAVQAPADTVLGRLRRLAAACGEHGDMHVMHEMLIYATMIGADTIQHATDDGSEHDEMPDASEHDEMRDDASEHDEMPE